MAAGTGKVRARVSVSDVQVDWDVVKDPTTGAYTVTRTTVESFGTQMSEAGARWLLDGILGGTVQITRPRRSAGGAR